LSSLAIALAAFVILSLSGFVSQYQSAIEEEVEGLGYDMLITARGCPYEAATLMLRGGVGLRYMPGGALAEIEADEDVVAVFPVLIHLVRDPASETGMLLFRGMSEGSFEARGLVFREGKGFEAGLPGVVLGHEIAELELLVAGDAFLVPEGLDRPAQSLPVLGVLERAGDQLDGSVMMALPALQTLFGLEDRLTGVGVQLKRGSEQTAQRVQDRYEQNPALQVVQLSAVLERLRLATDRMAAMVVLMSSVVALLALCLLFNTALLRASAEHRQVVVLHAIGLSSLFLFLATVVESFFVVLLGLGLGALGTVAFGDVLGGALADQLPYVPDSAHVSLGSNVFLALLLAGLAFSFLSAVPRLIRLQSARPQQMREA
jgi:hypothetical protein